MIRFRPAAALALALAAAVPLGAATASAADGRENRQGTDSLTPVTAPYNAAAAVSAVYGADYTAIRELEWERGGWQVKAIDAAGRRVELRVDATTGAVSRQNR